MLELRVGKLTREGAGSEDVGEVDQPAAIRHRRIRLSSSSSHVRSPQHFPHPLSPSLPPTAGSPNIKLHTLPKPNLPLLALLPLPSLPPLPGLPGIVPGLPATPPTETGLPAAVTRSQAGRGGDASMALRASLAVRWGRVEGKE